MMCCVEQLDYRFSLANERTYLAWIRTSFALIAGGIVAAKALQFHHDVWRWLVAVPPIVVGAGLAAHAAVRWRSYDEAMRAGRPLPAQRGLPRIGLALGVYALVALLASVLDG